jgi:CheY-like chemotaxis protein
MDGFFKAKRGKVLVVDNSGASRIQLKEVLKELGFSDVVMAPTVKEALGVLEAGGVRWVITSLMPEEPENGLQIIKLHTECQQLQPLSCSLIIENSEKYVVPTAFQYGLLSWHLKPFTRESLVAAVQTLVSNCERLKHNYVFVASEYLRDFLTREEMFFDRLGFERELIKAFPLEHDLVLNLVEPLVKTNNPEKAKSILKMVMSFDKPLARHAESLWQQFFGNDSLKDEGVEISALTAIGLDSVVVIDSDATVHAQLTQIFKSSGIENVVCFTSGLDAISHISENPNPDLVLMEWKIQGLAGPMLLQRLKTKDAINTPIIVISSLVKKEDLPLLKEYGAAAIIEKPLNNEQLVRTVVLVFQDEYKLTSIAVLERRIRELLYSNNLEEAKVLKEKFDKEEQVSPRSRMYVEAEFSYAKRDYEIAYDYAVSSLKHAGDSLLTLNLMGKILTKLGSFDMALKCFEKAQSISPLNVERLCSIAAVSDALGDDEKSLKALDEAKKIDSGNTNVTATEISLSLKREGKRNSKNASAASKNTVVDSVVASLNNSAVAMVRSGNFSGGIKNYHSALSSIPTERPDLRSKVLYNMGLAHIRQGDGETAGKVLMKCASNGSSRVEKKAKSLISKIDQVKKTSGKNISSLVVEGQLEETESAAGEAEGIAARHQNSSRDLKQILATDNTAIGCYNLFRPHTRNEQALQLIAQMPVLSFENEAALNQKAKRQAK